MQSKHPNKLEHDVMSKDMTSTEIKFQHTDYVEHTTKKWEKRKMKDKTQNKTYDIVAYRKEYGKKYRSSAEYKAKHAANERARRQTEEGKLSSRKASQKWREKQTEEKLQELKEKAKISAANYQKENREQVTAYAREWRHTPEGREKFKAAQKRYKEKLRLKKLAEKENNNEL